MVDETLRVKITGFGKANQEIEAPASEPPPQEAPTGRRSLYRVARELYTTRDNQYWLRTEVGGRSWYERVASPEDFDPAMEPLPPEESPDGHFEVVIGTAQQSLRFSGAASIDTAPAVIANQEPVRTFAYSITSICYPGLGCSGPTPCRCYYSYNGKWYSVCVSGPC